MSDTWIRASEVGEYVYCARAWWLGRVQGVRRTDDGLLARGEAGHRQHRRAVALAAWAWRVGAGLLIVGLAAALLLMMAQRW